MIIKLFLDAIYGVFSVLTSVINIPSLPPEVTSYLYQALEYITTGIGILANYTDVGYLMILLGLIVSIDVGIGIYHFVMWVIRKIPMANIS